MHGRRGGLGERQRRHRRADNEREPAPVSLVAELVDRGDRILREAGVTNVADHTDNRVHDRLRFERQRGAVADWIGIAPQQPGGGAADEHHVDITVREVAPAQQRQAHRTEVAWRDLADRDRRLILGEQFRAPVDHDRLLRAAGERERVDDGGGLHARQHSEALQRAVEECAGLRRRLVSSFGERYLEGQQVAGIEAGLDMAKRQQAAQHDAGAHQQHDRERNLADDEQTARLEADGARFAAALFQGVVEIGPARADRRQHAGKDTGQHRCAEHEEQDTAVDRNLIGARYLIGEQGGARGEAGARQQQAHDSTGRGEHERLDQQLLEHPGASGAERSTDRELLAPAERARKQQVADIGAGNQQHERHGREQHHERGADIADDQLLQRHDGGAPAGVLLRVVALEPHRDRFHLRIRPGDVDARLQPRDHRIVVVVADRPIGVLVRHRHPQVAMGDAP